MCLQHGRVLGIIIVIGRFNMVAPPRLHRRSAAYLVCAQIKQPQSVSVRLDEQLAPPQARGQSKTRNRFSHKVRVLDLYMQYTYTNARHTIFTDAKQSVRSSGRQ